MKTVIRLDVSYVSTNSLAEILIAARELAVEKFEEMIHDGDHFDHVSVSGECTHGSYTIDFN